MTSWMREEPKGPSEEDYLLGKAVDKNFEQQGTMGQINAVEYGKEEEEILVSHILTVLLFIQTALRSPSSPPRLATRSTTTGSCRRTRSWPLGSRSSTQGGNCWITPSR